MKALGGGDGEERKKEDACAYCCVVLSSNQSLALALGVQKATIAKSCYQEDGVPFVKGRGGRESHFRILLFIPTLLLKSLHRTAARLPWR